MGFPKFIFTIMIVALAASFSVAAQAPDAAPSTPVETLELSAFEPTRVEAVLEAYVDGVVEAHMRKDNTPGVTVSVVREGKLVFAKGYGFADIEAGTPVSGRDTLFRIGSVSKTFVWASVMMLAEQGKINLDEDVNTYLEGIDIPEAFGAPITMNHLMAHRAGFEETFGLFTYADDSEITLTEGLIRDMPRRVHAPGARTSYSNWGAGLAAKIVEDVSGKSFEDFLQSEILTPLAMTRTTLKVPSFAPENLRPLFSKAYKVSGGAIEDEGAMQIGPFAPVGAMGATAADMAQWMLLLLGDGDYNGARLYSEETAAKMWARAFDDRPAAGDLAHGFFTKTYEGYDVYGHGGGTAGFLTFMQVAPGLGAGVFVSQNSATQSSLVNELPDLIIARLAAPEKTFGAIDTNGLSPQAAMDYTGTYISNRRSRSKFEKLFGATQLVSVSRGEGGGLVISGELAPRVAWPLAGAKDVFQARDGNTIAFGRDETGRVTHFSTGWQSFDRAGFLDNPLGLALGFGLAGFFAATTFVGAWRRQGREVSQTAIGRGLGVFALIAAGAMAALLGALAMAGAALSGLNAADMITYPPTWVVWFRTIALFGFVIAALAIVSLAPAWTKSGWSVWRKAHHTAFALSLAFMGVMLVLWKVIFAATA